MKNTFDEFTKQYAVSKTLRFELKPVGETAKNICKKFIRRKEFGKAEGKDAKRAEDYVIVKRMLNELHRHFIAEALSTERVKNHFESKDLKPCFEAWEDYQRRDSRGQENEEDENDNDETDSFLKKQKELCKRLKACLSETEKDWKNDYNDALKTKTGKEKNINVSKIVYSKAVFPILKKIIEDQKNKEGAKKIIKVINKDKEDKQYYSEDELLKFLKTFDKFHTYFSGFNENRENIYDTGNDSAGKLKLKSTSIAYRLFEQNIQFHFQNIQSWEKIKKSIDEGTVKKENREIKISEVLQSQNWNWNKKIKELENKPELSVALDGLFTPEYFLSCFNQDGIDRYNSAIGGLPAEAEQEKIRGINEIINLTLQQIKKAGYTPNRKQFPAMQEFYKQILSLKGDFIDEFHNDKELLQAVKSFREESIRKQKWGDNDTNEKDIFEHIDNQFDDLFKEINESSDKKENYYLSEKAIQKISAEVTGNYNTFHHIWGDYVDELIGEDAKKYTKKQKCISFYDIEKNIYKRLNKDEKTSEWENREFSIKIYTKEKFEKLLETGYNYRDSTQGNKKVKKRGLRRIIEDKVKQDEIKLDKESDIPLIKEFLDSCLEFARFIKSFHVRDKDINKHQSLDESRNFLVTINKIMRESFDIIPLYNQARNYISKKEFSLDKIKLCFDNPGIAKGWDKNKETDNLCVLLIKEGRYFLGIMDKEHKSLFEEGETNVAEINKQIEEKEACLMRQQQILVKKREGTKIYQKTNERVNSLQAEIKELKDTLKLIQGSHKFYQKMDYKFFKDVTTMIPKCSTQLREVKRHFENSKKDYDNLEYPNKFIKKLTITKEIFDLNNLVFNKKTKKFEKKKDNNDKRPKKIQKRISETI